MSRALKFLLITAAAIVLVAGGVALAATIWWNTKGAEVVASLGDGTRYALGQDRQACVTEAVLRVKRASGAIGFADQVKNELFLEECLKAAAPVDGFCAGVPAKSNLATSVAWRKQTSEKYGLEGTLRQGLVKEIQDFCDRDASEH